MPLMLKKEQKQTDMNLVQQVLIRVQPSSRNSFIFFPSFLLFFLLLSKKAREGFE